MKNKNTKYFLKQLHHDALLCIAKMKKVTLKKFEKIYKHHLIAYDVLQYLYNNDFINLFPNHFTYISIISNKDTEISLTSRGKEYYLISKLFKK